MGNKQRKKHIYLKEFFVCKVNNNIESFSFEGFANYSPFFIMKRNGRVINRGNERDLVDELGAKYIFHNYYRPEEKKIDFTIEQAE